MRSLSECFEIPKSAPTLEKAPKSKSKKVFKLKDEWFFLAQSGVGSTLYSIRLRVQLAYYSHQDKDKIFRSVMKIADAIKGLNSDFE
jgi:hypothetical protein